MTYCVSIDVGVKNLGLCVFDYETARVIHWENVSLVPNGRYIPAQNVQYVRDFVAKYHDYFELACSVVIERQMRCNMRIIEAVLQTLFYDRTTIVSPRSVKAHYRLATQNYRQNKAAAVDWATNFIAHNPSAFAPGVVAQFDVTKRDDMADSLLTLMYYLDTYSNQLGS